MGRRAPAPERRRTLANYWEYYLRIRMGEFLGGNILRFRRPSPTRLVAPTQELGKILGKTSIVAEEVVMMGHDGGGSIGDTTVELFGNWRIGRSTGGDEHVRIGTKYGR
eukprot:7269756-Pyramimonas_sp.AAC.1